MDRTHRLADRLRYVPCATVRTAGRRQHHDHDAIERGEVTHHAQNRLLLRADDMGGSHELHGATELSARSGCRDLCDRLASPYQRPGIGLHARARFDWVPTRP
jgi:hypothetical protein